MKHGSATPQLDITDVRAHRLVQLTLEFLEADPSEHDRINAEFMAVRDGKVAVLGNKK